MKTQARELSDAPECPRRMRIVNNNTPTNKRWVKLKRRGFIAALAAIPVIGPAVVAALSKPKAEFKTLRITGVDQYGRPRMEIVTLPADDSVVTTKHKYDLLG
jgi:hypothetical protein